MSVSGTLKVLLVDDHALVRIGLASVIADEPGMEVCGQATTGMHAIESYRALRPDVVLLDMRLPDINGVRVTEALHQEFPDAKVLIISSYAADEEIYAALAAGAQAYVLKTIEVDELVEVIRTVAAGQRHIPADIAARLAACIHQSDLTDRERDVLRLLGRGRRNREIAQDLGIASTTVKTHVGSILLKLGVTDRTEAATIAIERGIISPPSAAAYPPSSSS
jgi:two-component system NarL family response regulator